MKLSFYLLILNCFFFWLLLKTETWKMNKLHKKLYFFGLKANLDWNFRVELFWKVACASLIGVPTVWAFNVFNAKESQLFSENLLFYKPFWVLLTNMVQIIPFKWYPLALQSSFIISLTKLTKKYNLSLYLNRKKQ